MKKSDILIVGFIVLIYVLYFSNIISSASVEGVSMYPTFQNGALTFYTSPHNVSLGNIIIYKSPTVGAYVIHRVVSVNYYNGEKYYVTQGVDKISNPKPDNQIGLEPLPGIPSNLVLGKVDEYHGVIFSIPYLGYISILLNSLI
jgi:signal peptidase